MRTLHRWVMTLVVVLLIYLALTGLVIQADGLYALYRPGAANVAEIAAIREGPSGPGNFTRMEPPSAFARSLPSDDLQTLLSRAVQAARREAPDLPMRSVELRVINTQPQAVFVMGAQDSAPRVYDLATGTRIAGPAFPGDRQDRDAPRSLYGRVKGWHEGNFLGIAGLWIDALLAVGLALLAVTGICLYLQLYGRRRELGRGGWIWK